MSQERRKEIADIIAEARRGSQRPDRGRGQLAERLLAIEAVCHAYPGTRLASSGPLVEHLLVDLVDYLDSSVVDRDIAVEGLIRFLNTWPQRVGAAETVEFVAHALRWPELQRALEDVAKVTAIDHLTRAVARSALLAFGDGWEGKADYRAFQ